MAGSFGELIEEMDDAIFDVLSDVVAEHLDASGAVLASEVPVMIEKSVERLDVGSGAIDKVTTFAVRKVHLVRYDRKGSFLVGGKKWHIDGIAADDGYLITFYVVP